MTKIIHCHVKAYYRTGVPNPDKSTVAEPEGNGKKGKKRANKRNKKQLVEVIPTTAQEEEEMLNEAIQASLNQGGEEPEQDEKKEDEGDDTPKEGLSKPMSSAQGPDSKQLEVRSRNNPSKTFRANLWVNFTQTFSLSNNRKEKDPDAYNSSKACFQNELLYVVDDTNNLRLFILPELLKEKGNYRGELLLSDVSLVSAFKNYWVASLVNREVVNVFGKSNCSFRKGGLSTSGRSLQSW